jgi:hypothetical protein
MHPARRPQTLYGLYAVALTVVLIVASENLLFRDFGDFVRAIGFMVELTPDPTGQHWPFRATPLPLGERFDLGNHVFGAMGWLQSQFADHFDLRFSAVAAKLCLALSADLLARQVARDFRHRLRARAIVFTALMACMFAAHNAGMLKSFYDEYLFFLVLPPLLYALLRCEQARWQWLLLAMATLAGLSKVQYFYVPALVLLSLLAMRSLGQLRPPAWLLAALCAAQVVCALPALHNPFAQLNRHQSTYWGSYLVLNDAELRQLGLSERQLACVGVDGWGHRAQGPGGSEPINVGAEHSCYGHQTLGLADILRPYWRYPSTLPRLLAYALPAHFHVQYFHVYKNAPYLAPANGASYRSGRWLVRLSALRDATVTPLGGVLLVCGVMQLAWRRTRSQTGLSTCAFFLALFSASQVLVSLLGEGVRDLGKHLWGAQLALDLLALVLLAQCARLIARQRHRPSAAPSS